MRMYACVSKKKVRKCVCVYLQVCYVYTYYVRICEYMAANYYCVYYCYYKQRRDLLEILIQPY